MNLLALMIMLYLIAMGTKNMISMWYYMEIGSFIFIFSMLKKNNPTKANTIYFLISFVSSLMMFLSVIFSNMDTTFFHFLTLITNENSFFLSMAMCLKLGAMPFHSWVFSMTSNMEWLSLILLFSTQKLIPIWILINFNNPKMITFFALFSIILSPMLPLKSKNPYFLLSTSSVINNIWIILATLSSLSSTVWYSLTYFIINSNLINLLKKNNMKIFNKTPSMLIVLYFLTIMGFPPLPMFFIKIIIIKNILLHTMIMVTLLTCLIINNMITSIMYLKFTIQSLLSFSLFSNSQTLKYKSNLFNYFLIVSPYLFITSMNLN